MAKVADFGLIVHETAVLICAGKRPTVSQEKLWYSVRMGISWIGASVGNVAKGFVGGPGIGYPCAERLLQSLPSFLSIFPFLPVS